MLQLLNTNPFPQEHTRVEEDEYNHLDALLANKFWLKLQGLTDWPALESKAEHTRLSKYVSRHALFPDPAAKEAKQRPPNQVALEVDGHLAPLAELVRAYEACIMLVFVFLNFMKHIYT